MQNSEFSDFKSREYLSDCLSHAPPAVFFLSFSHLTYTFYTPPPVAIFHGSLTWDLPPILPGIVGFPAPPLFAFHLAFPALDPHLFLPHPPSLHKRLPFSHFFSLTKCPARPRTSPYRPQLPPPLPGDCFIPAPPCDVLLIDQQTSPPFFPLLVHQGRTFSLFAFPFLSAPGFLWCFADSSHVAHSGFGRSNPWPLPISLFFPCPSGKP